jgi:hypothetical protein
LLEKANLMLEVLRFQMRLAKDLQCLKVESYGFAKDGIRFLGYRVFPTHRLLPKENVRRFRRRVRRMQEDYAAGRLGFAEIYQRLMSWSGHARQANRYRLRCRLFDTIKFQRATADKPCVAWRHVQQ